MVANQALRFCTKMLLGGLLLGPAAASAEDEPCERSMTAIRTLSAVLTLYWRGKVTTGMAPCLRLEFEATKATVDTVSLDLDSPGGTLQGAEAVVALLKDIRKTHRLKTVVSPGSKCGSACVPVFLAGERRYGALSSVWLFHEVGVRKGVSGRLATDRTKTERALEDYFITAGVNEAWLDRLRPLIQHADYWQTGQNLWDSGSGIITDVIGNHVARGTERQKF